MENGKVAWQAGGFWDTGNKHALKQEHKENYSQRFYDYKPEHTYHCGRNNNLVMSGSKAQIDKLQVNELIVDRIQVSSKVGTTHIHIQTHIGKPGTWKTGGEHRETQGKDRGTAVAVTQSLAHSQLCG